MTGLTIGRRRVRQLAAPIVALSVLVIALSGCTTSSETPSAQTPVDSNPVTEMIKPKLTTDIKDGQVGFSPGAPVTAKVEDGKLTKVTLLNPDNVAVPGQLTPDGVAWQNTEALGYNRTYRLQAEAMGLGGTTSTTLSFTTSAPDNLTKAYLIPGDSDPVGIGQPVAIQFDENIPDRHAAQNAIKITTEPPVAGAFYWLSNREVRWRPEHFWAPGTKVHVNVAVYGKNLGGGLYGQEDVRSDFTIGDAMVFTADDATKQVVATRNGQVVKTMPTSMGKNSTPTDNGVYIVGGRYKSIVMDSSTYGVPVNSPAGYRITADWATQLAYNGIFFHSAPWSVGQQGHTNTSHGCLNLSPADAQWVYENTKRGDVTIVKNTVGGVLSGTDGLGDWNVPWPVWSAGNADQQ